MTIVRNNIAQKYGILYNAAMKKLDYYKRIADAELSFKLDTFGAVQIVGPKWCGKTTTAEQFAKSGLYLQKDPNKEALIETAKITPLVLLNGEKPRLIDEWQDAPEIWDAVRSYCDDTHKKGNFILTGSSSKKVKTAHTGTGRISTLKMYPMSLYESKESNGMVSLEKLFDNKESLKHGCQSSLTVRDLINCSCRGGWPESVMLKSQESQLAIAKDYFSQIYSEDMFHVDNVKRNPSTMRAVLKSYARNISTPVKYSNILKDINSTNSITDKTLDDYLEVLSRLYITDDIEAWCPAIRSKTAIRSSKKIGMVDPSLAVAGLGVNPDFFETDLKTFGFIFESLVIRDLRIYSSSLGGRVSYYRDRYGLESDAVLHLEDGRYALIEIKLGQHKIEDGASHLNEIERLIKEHNKKETQAPIRIPDLKIVITGTQYGYRRKDGVYVIPIGCLKD